MIENPSRDWSVDNMKSTGFNGSSNDFSIDYHAITVDDILDIYKYLMKNFINEVFYKYFFSGLAFYQAEIR